ncbi:MAG: DUF3798 domain-containing protein [Clostridia bacterium]|nr:DUF3798 domain-containing protein [Clostridia bacterium]
MLKKILAAVLVLTLVFTLAACSKNKVKVDLPEKKVAILVAPESQDPETYRRAKELEKTYSKNVVVREYPDSRVLKAGDPEIKKIAEELAADASIGALVFARATQFADISISAAKSANPALKILCVEPEQTLAKYAERSDFVFCCDWSKAAPAIIAQAKAQGAETFVMLSFDRQLNDNALTGGARVAFEEACKTQELKFYYESSLDPIFSGGISKAQQTLGEIVARMRKNQKLSNENVCFFSTDSSVQTALIEQAENNSFVYVSPAFPSIYSGVAELFPDLAAPESVKDTASFLTALKEAVAGRASKARLAAYTFPLAATLLDAAVFTAFDLLGETQAEDPTAQAITRLTEAGGKDFAAAAFSENLPNVIVGYADGFETLK